MKKLLIIIPAFNEEETILRTVTAVRGATDADYLVINDGSTDGTGTILRRNGIPHLELPVNLGIGGAMQTGYKYAVRHGYDYALQLDADGQHNPGDIARLLQAMEAGDSDMVIGSRFVETTGYKGSRSRRAGIYYFYWLIRLLTGMRIKDPTSGFRLVNRRVMERFARDYPGDYPEVEVIVEMARLGYKLKEIRVEMKARQGGRSSITPVKSAYYMAKVTVFSLIRWAF